MKGPGPREALNERPRRRKDSASRSSRPLRTYRWAGQILALGLFLLTLGIWQLATWHFRIPVWLLPSPGLIGQTLVTERGLLWANTFTTLTETLLGFGLAVFLGGVAALLIHFSSLARRVLEPWLVTSQTVPLLAFAPLLAVWFGFGLLPKVLVVFLVAFFPVVVNLADALESADPDMLRLVRSLGASRLRLLWEVELPSALPALFSGVRLTAAYAVSGAVVAEWTGATRGLGTLMLESSSQFETAETFAAIAVVSAMGIALYLTVGVVERFVVPWQRPRTDRGGRRS